MNDRQKERKIDIVMCIDATSSMGPCIDNVRANAKTLYSQFVDKMKTEYNSVVEELRLQIVTFRDLECDVNAIVKSEWFELPTDNARFQRCLDAISARGGGDYKESGLEAFFTAMNTDWSAKGQDDRQVIVLFTDADAIDFDEKKNRTGYETMCNADLFYSTWLCMRGNLNKMTERGKRGVFFAPADTVYSNLVKTMNRTIHYAVVPQNGMADVKFDDIIKMLCSSASSH